MFSAGCSARPPSHWPRTDRKARARAKSTPASRDCEGLLLRRQSLDCFNSPTETGLDIRLPAPHSSGWRGDHIADQSKSRKERKSPDFHRLPPLALNDRTKKSLALVLAEGTGTNRRVRCPPSAHGLSASGWRYSSSLRVAASPPLWSGIPRSIVAGCHHNNTSINNHQGQNRKQIKCLGVGC